MILYQIIFHHIHIDQTVAEKGNSLCLLICIDHRRQHLLSIIHKQLGAETVSDQPKLYSAFLMSHKASALMDHRPPGTGKFAVDL